MKETKFYEFDQNNSGGSFDVDNEVCHRVVIEATSPEKANEKAQSLGIYFDGCAEGLDCPCCGDRWGECDEYDATSFPKEFTKGQFFNTPESYYQMLADTYGWTKPDVRIYYKSGKVSEIFSEDKNA